jgi:hypothetical protein
MSNFAFMKHKIKQFWLLSCIFLTAFPVLSQVFTNNGASVTVNNTAQITINGNTLIKLDGDFDHDGIITSNGDLTNNGSTTVFTAGTGEVRFIGTALQNINGSGSLNFYNFTSNNTSTGILMGTSIAVSNTLDMQDGNIELNGNNIDLGTTGTLTGESNDDRIFGTTGSLTTTRILNAPTNVNVAGTGIEITSAANMGSTVITRRHNQYGLSSKKRML